MWSDFSQFHFLRPEWFLASIPLVLLIAWLRFEKTAQGDWHQLIPEHLLKYLIHEQRGSSSKHAITLLALLWLLCVIALAGPSWQKIPQPVYEKIEARVYVLDLSYSMYAADLKPNRISRARLKLLDLLTNNREGYSALIVFSGDAHIVTPLTNDTNTIAALIPSLEPGIMPNIGSNVSEGIQKALELLYNTKIETGKIILITDEVPDKEVTRINALMDKSRFTLSILGIGTKDGAPIKLPNGQFLKDKDGSVVIPKLDNANLKQLAQLHNGIYVPIQQDDRDINQLLKDSITDDEAREGTQEYDIWFESGQWLMLPILILAALSFRRGWILGLIFCVSILSSPEQTYADSGNTNPFNAVQQQASANPDTSKQQSSIFDKTKDTVSSWFQTGDQRGLEKFKQQKFTEAAQLFNNQDWKASSLFYGGQFAEASEQFEVNDNASKQKQSDSWYNKGNALAFARDYDGAIKAYDRSLELNPENEDAAFNKELVEKAKEFEKEQQQQEQNNQEQNQDSQQDQNSQQDQSNQDSSQQDSQQDQQKSQNQQNNDSESQDDENEQQNNDQQNSQEQQESQDSQDNSEDSSENENKDSDTENADTEQSQNEENTSEEEKSEQQTSEEIADEADESLSPLSPEEREKQQALEQWLRQIPDDPSGLMRRKFLLESQRNKQQRSDEQQVW